MKSLQPKAGIEPRSFAERSGSTGDRGLASSGKVPIPREFPVALFPDLEDESHQAVAFILRRHDVPEEVIRDFFKR